MVEGLKTFLQGKWLRHSLHSVVVTFPLGLWVMSLLFDFWNLARGGSHALMLASLWAIGGGVAGVLLAVPTGIADWLEVKRGKPAWRLGLIHAGVNVVAAVIFLTNLVLRARLPDETALVPGWAVLLSAAGTVVVIGGAYLGGRMVYQHGVGVARFSKHDLRSAAEAAGSRVPGEEKS